MDVEVVLEELLEVVDGLAVGLDFCLLGVDFLLDLLEVGLVLGCEHGLLGAGLDDVVELEEELVDFVLEFVVGCDEFLGVAGLGEKGLLGGWCRLFFIFHFYNWDGAALADGPAAERAGRGPTGAFARAADRPGRLDRGAEHAV